VCEAVASHAVASRQTNKFSVGTHELFCHISTRSCKAADAQGEVAAGLENGHAVEHKKKQIKRLFFSVRAGLWSEGLFYTSHVMNEISCYFSSTYHLFYNIRENKLSCCHLILQDISF
jgi:hypothetical protein